MSLNIFLLVLLLIATSYCIIAMDVLYAAISLGIVSVILTIVMFLLGAPLAGVFELSVCAGLITVIFASTISLTKRESNVANESGLAIGKIKRYVILPLVVLAVFALLFAFGRSFDLPLLQPDVGVEVRDVIWGMRPWDLIGQMIIILTGVFGVIVLFKEKVKND